jgi:hypothetical protein
MKRPEPKKEDTIRKEAGSYFLEKTSLDEDLDQEDTSLSDPRTSPYYPANLDPDFDPAKFIKNS